MNLLARCNYVLRIPLVAPVAATVVGDKIISHAKLSLPTVIFAKALRTSAKCGKNRESFDDELFFAAVVGTESKEEG